MDLLSSPAEWEDFFETRVEKKLRQFMYETGHGKKSFYVDVKNELVTYREMRIYEELVEFPDDVIKHAHEGLWDIYNPIDGVNLKGYFVRFVNLPLARRISPNKIEHTCVNKFYAIEGIVTRASLIMPYVVEAVYKCKKCGSKNVMHVDISPTAKLTKPYKCKACNDGRRFELLDGESKTIPYQIIQIQELPENLSVGEEPRTVLVILTNDIAGKVFAGERVVVNGIVRLLHKGDRPIMDYYIEANSIEVLEKGYDEVKISEEDKCKIEELSKDKNLVSKIVNSIAPSIRGHYYTKLAIALQLFGGVRRTSSDGSECRGDIHVLIVGDPSTAKTKLIKWVKNLVPRAVYSSGKGVSKAGLTAAVVKDEFTGKWVLEAGVLPLADGGLAIVDELEKMSKDEREMLHEALESQIITIDKANIHTYLRTRCSLLAAANPAYSRFDRYEPVTSQINIEPSLLSRFDLIFAVFDIPDKEEDRKIAEHMYEVIQFGGKPPEIDIELLKKYISYARKYVEPFISDEARSKISEFYMEIREKSMEGSVAISVRQLEGLYRLSTAAAKMRLSNRVEECDVDLAIEIFTESLKSLGLDLTSDGVDIDVVYSDTPKTKRDKIKVVVDILRELDEVRGVNIVDIVLHAEKKGLDKADVEEVLDKMKQIGVVYCPKYNHYRLVDV